MAQYEYQVIPAPRRGERGKGLKTAEARFANALTRVMNRMAADDWEYLRTDTLPLEERSGLTGRTTTFQHLMIFRRRLPTTSAPLIPEAVPAPATTSTPGVTASTPAPAPAPAELGHDPLDMAARRAAISAQTAPPGSSPRIGPIHPTGEAPPAPVPAPAATSLPDKPPS